MRLRDKLARQFVQYVAVGGVAFIVDFSTLYLLAEFARLHYLVAGSFAFLLGLAVSYRLCVTWVFDFRAVDNRVNEFLVFAATGLAGLALTNVLLYVLTELAGFHYLGSKLFAAAFVLLFNFASRRFLLFSERRPSGAARAIGAAAETR